MPLKTSSLKILIIFLSIFLTLSVLEIGTRLFLKQQTSLVEKGEFIPFTYKPNLNVSIEKEGGGSNHFITNSFGFVGKEWEKEKPVDTIRIAHLGDSFTAAVSVPYDVNFTSLIEKGLSEKTGKNFESLNFGIGGQGTGEALETYKHYAREFKPDTVILWFFLGNDFEDNLVYEESTKTNDPISFGDYIKIFAKKFELAHLIVNRLAKNPNVANYLHGRVLKRVGDDSLGDEARQLPLTIRLLFTDDKENILALERTENFLRDLKSETQKDKAELLVVMISANLQVEKEVREDLFIQYPKLRDANFDDTRPNSSLVKIFRSLGIEHLDLTENFKKACIVNCNLYLVPNGHLSKEGHELAAGGVSRFLEVLLTK